MHQLGTRYVKGLRVSSLFLSLLLTACDEPIIYNELRYADITGEIWEGHNPNKIHIQCGKDCTTLSFEKKWLGLLPFTSAVPKEAQILIQQQKRLIQRFLRHQNKGAVIYVAPCDTGFIQNTENKKLARWVANQVSKAGYTPWISRAVIPQAQNSPLFCVNLVKGSLSIIPPNCPNLRVKDSVYHIASDFGCSTNHNFATMINPWDYLAPPGERSAVPDARITHGNMDYNEGKVAKIFIPKPNKTNADNN